MDQHYGPLPGYVPYDGSLGHRNVPLQHHPPPQVQPPQQLPSVERVDVISKTYEDLVARMKHAQNSKRHDRFITQEDIDAVYADPERIPALIQPDCRNVQLEKVRTEMRLIISILVLIGARECLASFGRSLYRRMTPDLTDKDLPVTMTSALSFLPLEKRDSFMHHQYAVLAIKLKEPYEPTTLHYGGKFRLPFERVEEIGVGGYGKVEKVWIPRGYLEDKHGQHHTVVACKRFKVEKEFAKEAENIELLRSRLTRHNNIMLHLMTIAREETRFILLPLAAHLDLGIFLRYGFDEVNKKVYDFQHTFPHVGKPDGPLARQVTLNIFEQAVGIASALEWLHHDISGTGTADPLYCTHMDLKPSNILIDIPVSTNSTVGIWKISDFGISVFREDSHQQDSNVVSPLDYVKLLTSKTRPKRVPGSYTAPEVNGSAATVGRGSDVWSFACLFSEVVLFAVERHALVQEFRDVRAKQMKNDYFYMPQTGQHLLAPGQGDQYQLKDKMVVWLYELPIRFPAHSAWLSCYIMTVFDMLVVDPNQRPLSKHLVTMVRHLRAHFDAVSTGRPITCRLSASPELVLRPKPSLEMAAKRMSQTSPRRQSTSSHPDGMQHQRYASSSSAAQQPQVSSSNQGPSIRRVSTRSGETIHQSNTRTQTPVTSPVSPLDPFQSPPGGDYRSRTNSTRSSRPSISTIGSPPAGPGIVISNPNGKKPPNYGYIPLSTASIAQRPVPLDKLGTAADISFSPDGELLAYLIKTTVYIFKFNRRWDSTTEMAPISLPVEVQWKHVAVAGDFLTVGGRSDSGQKQVIFMRLSVRKHIYGPPHQEISTLSSIRMTASGAVALMCQRCIVYTSIDLYASYGNQTTLRIDEPQSYGSIAFDGTGSLLHAWIFGRERDELHTWHIQDESTDLRKPLKQNFARSEGGVGNPRLFPYTDCRGVVIEAPATRFFTSSTTSARKDATKVIGHVYAAKIFRDFSFITVEAESMWSHGRLKEYPISHHTGRSLGEKPQELGKLQHIKPIGEGPLAMFVTSYRSTDAESKTVIAVASGKGKIETVHFETFQFG